MRQGCRCIHCFIADLCFVEVTFFFPSPYFFYLFIYWSFYFCVFFRAIRNQCLPSNPRANMENNKLETLRHSIMISACIDCIADSVRVSILFCFFFFFRLNGKSGYVCSGLLLYRITRPKRPNSYESKYLFNTVEILQFYLQIFWIMKSRKIRPIGYLKRRRE